MTSYGYFPLLSRVFVLSVISFCSKKKPSVGFKHSYDLNNFI